MARFTTLSLVLFALLRKGYGVSVISEEEEAALAAVGRTRGEAQYEKWRAAFRECRRQSPSSPAGSRPEFEGTKWSPPGDPHHPEPPVAPPGGTVVWNAMTAPTLGNALSGFLPVFGEALRSDARLLASNPTSTTPAHAATRHPPQQARLARYLRLGLSWADESSGQACSETPPRAWNSSPGSPTADCGVSVRVLGNGNSASARSDVEAARLT